VTRAAAIPERKGPAFREIYFDPLVFRKGSIQGENCHLGSHKANAVRRAIRTAGALCQTAAWIKICMSTHMVALAFFQAQAICQICPSIRQ
jgi:hypothetical protein